MCVLVERSKVAFAHLAVEQRLLFQTKVLRGVGHDGEGGFWIVPKREGVMVTSVVSINR